MANGQCICGSYSPTSFCSSKGSCLYHSTAYGGGNNLQTINLGWNASDVGLIGMIEQIRKENQEKKEKFWNDFLTILKKLKKKKMKNN